jgi:hypothetical protein
MYYLAIYYGIGEGWSLRQYSTLQAVKDAITQGEIGGSKIKRKR